MAFECDETNVAQAEFKTESLPGLKCYMQGILYELFGFRVEKILIKVLKCL